MKRIKRNNIISGISYRRANTKSPIFNFGNYIGRRNTLTSINIPRRSIGNIWSPIRPMPMAAFWRDSDGDGVYNGLDCEPHNRFKQGPWHKSKEEKIKRIAEFMGAAKEARKLRERSRLRTLNAEGKLVNVYKKHKPFREEHSKERIESLPIYKNEEEALSALDIVTPIDQHVGKLAKPYLNRRYTGLPRTSHEILDIAKHNSFLEDEEKQKIKKLVKEKFNEKYAEKDISEKRKVSILRRLKSDVRINERQYNLGLNRLKEKLDEPIKNWHGRFGDSKPIFTGKILNFSEKDIKKMAPKDEVKNLLKKEKEERKFSIENTKEIDEVIEDQDNKQKEEAANIRLLEKLHNKISSKLGSEDENEIFDDLGDFEIDEK